MRNKKKLTEELILLLPEEERISPQSARIAWWFNLRPRGGMRLTTLKEAAAVESAKKDEVITVKMDGGSF